MPELPDTMPETEPVVVKPSMVLLPGVPDGTCPVCAVAHEADLPHDLYSLRYQYAFWGEHDRWPTWADAMAHCDPEMRARFAECVRAESGIEIGEDDHARAAETYARTQAAQTAKRNAARLPVLGAGVAARRRTTTESGAAHA